MEKFAVAKAADYTLNRVNSPKSLSSEGRIEIDNNLAKNAIHPNVIGRKNLLFSSQ
ncbi:transposase [Lysinibacillus sp. M3]|uniref:Transposase n=1 Tax=Lysinibacillus zambalensis TaxID=3160866 RepID=A0ABV1MWF7_9BACI